MSEPTYRIKPLVWEDYGGRSEAHTIRGYYRVYQWAKRCAWREGGSRDFRLCASIEDGKRLAEEHWRERILEALEEA